MRIVEFARDLLENMFAGHQTDAMVMLFSTAFHEVVHIRLLTELMVSEEGKTTV